MAAAIGAIGLTLLVGVAGQLSLGHAFFVAVGAYGYACPGRATRTPAAGLGLPPGSPRCSPWRSPALAGAAVQPDRGPAARASTWAWPPSAWSSSASTCCSTPPTVTGGFNGRDVAAVQPVRVLSFTTSDPDVVVSGVPFGAAGAALVPVPASLLVGCAAWFARNVLRGRPGRALAAIRDSEIAAAVDGRGRAPATGPPRSSVSSAYAGLAGVLLALAFGRIVPDSFGFAHVASTSSP